MKLQRLLSATLIMAMATGTVLRHLRIREGQSCALSSEIR